GRTAGRPGGEDRRTERRGSDSRDRQVLAQRRTGVVNGVERELTVVGRNRKRVRGVRLGLDASESYSRLAVFLEPFDAARIEEIGARVRGADRGRRDDARFNWPAFSGVRPDGVGSG